MDRSERPRIRLPKTPRMRERERAARQLAQTPKPRDELAKPIGSMVELGTYVRALRAGLGIRQAELALRAGVGRELVVHLEQGKPTVQAEKVLRVLLTLGFEIVLAPYDPPPPWMLRACAFADAKAAERAAGRRTRRNTRRAHARDLRLAANTRGMVVDVE